MTTDYDSIIIGSGAGGLTTAVTLAQAGQKVLVLEQHEVPGGWTHSFTLEGYKFSPGVHYIGGLEPGGSMRAIYEGLGVSQDLAFCELNPDGFDHILISGERFDIPKGQERFAKRLQQRFPQEAAGIDGFLTAVTDMSRELSRFKPADTLRLPRTAPNLLRWGWRSAQAMINHFVADPLLRAIFASQSGDHGLPPSLVSAPVHAAIVNHYLNGGYYPKGGGFAIPRAFVRALKRAGGEIRLQTAVTSILIKDGRAIGVRLTDGTEIRARHIISNADPEVTFGQLIGRKYLSRKLRRKLNRMTYSVSALSLFLASSMDLRAAGLDSGNVWFYRHGDLDQLYRDGMSDKAAHDHRPDMLFLTATTLKDPSKMHNGHHTLEAFTFVNYAPFKRWANTKMGERGNDYYVLKQQIAAGMLATIEEIVPGFRDSLEFCDLGTPLSNEFYINATQGNLYGIAKSRFQVGPWAFRNRTEIEGLWVCGASTTAGHGVTGATASGLMTARYILGCRLRDLLNQNGPELPIYPAEDVSQWPGDLQK